VLITGGESGPQVQPHTHHERRRHSAAGETERDKGSLIFFAYEILPIHPLIFCRSALADSLSAAAAANDDHGRYANALCFFRVSRALGNVGGDRAVARGWKLSRGTSS